MLITQASFEDLRDILDLQYAVFQREATEYNDFSIQPLKQTPGELQAEFERGIFYKAAADNKIIGSVRAMTNYGTTFVRMLVVDPKMQGRGIGTKLVRTVENNSVSGRFEIHSSIRCPLNIKLYQRLGYVKFREKIISANNGFIYLEKHIDNGG